MRLNDQIAILCREAGNLAELCPASGDNIEIADAMWKAARRISGVAAWLEGQSTLIRGDLCPACRGLGFFGEGNTCTECGGSGRVPIGQPESPPATQPPT